VVPKLSLNWWLSLLFHIAPIVCPWTRQTVCAVTGMTRTLASIVVNIHIWLIFPVKLCVSQDQNLSAGLAALHYSLVLFQSPSPTYAPQCCLAWVLSTETWLTIMQCVVRHEIGIHAVMYMSLQYLAKRTQDLYRLIIFLVFSIDPFLRIRVISQVSTALEIVHSQCIC